MKHPQQHTPDGGVRVPCPVPWPECHPGGCRTCGGAGDYPVELPPRPRLSLLSVAIDVLVWVLCAAFACAVAVSYLIAVTPQAVTP